MAIMVDGRIVELGQPQQLIERLRGKIWKGTLERAELAAVHARLNVISTRLRAGRTEIHVSSEVSPGPGFEPATATLDDFYFSTLQAQRRAAAQPC